MDAMKHEYQALDNDDAKKKTDFMEFALNFVDNLGSNFVNLTPKNAQRCKQIIFPRGQDTIEPEDTVIVVTTHTGLRDISDILR